MFYWRTLLNLLNITHVSHLPSFHELANVKTCFKVILKMNVIYLNIKVFVKRPCSITVYSFFLFLICGIFFNSATIVFFISEEGNLCTRLQSNMVKPKTFKPNLMDKPKESKSGIFLYLCFFYTETISEPK